MPEVWSKLTSCSVRNSRLIAARHVHADVVDEQLNVRSSPAITDREVASGHLAFVGGEGSQNFGLLARRDLDEVERTSEFRSDLIEFRGGDPEVSVGRL